MNIAQILHLSNFFEMKRRVYIHLQAKRTRKVLDIQLVYHSLQITVAVRDTKFGKGRLTFCR